MIRFRFSIAALMGVVALLGLVFAALRAESQLWSQLVFTVTTVLLLLVLVAVVYSQKEARAFWVGIAIVGWGHWFLESGPGMKVDRSLLNWGLTEYLHPKLQRTVPQPVSPAAAVVGPSLRAVSVTLHSLLTLVLALIGGVFGRVLYLTRKDAGDAGGPP